MKLLSDPFQVDTTGAAVKYQMELTDIQNDSDLKRAFSEQDLLSFDSVMFHQTVTPIYHRSGCQEIHCSVW